MNTVDMIQKIRQRILADPSFMNGFPWSELNDCLLAELHIREQLYPVEQFAGLLRRITGYMNTIRAQMTVQTVSLCLEKLIDILTLLPEADYTCSRLEEANFARAYWKHHRSRTTLVLGDSHVNFFGGHELLNFIPIGHNINTCPAREDFTFSFTPLHLGPCLAYNADNPKATYNSMEKTEFLCNEFISPGSNVICSFGEIDLRVHVLKQAGLQGVSFQRVTEDILKHYAVLLEKLKSRGYHVYCWGAIATQKDSHEQDPMFPHYGSEQDRNRATEYYNMRLREYCAGNGLGYMSIFDKMIDSDYRTKEIYLSDDGCHLSQRALPLAVEEWNRCGLP